MQPVCKNSALLFWFSGGLKRLDISGIPGLFIKICVNDCNLNV